MKNLKVVLCLFLFVIPLMSIAHPGHGETSSYTIKHYLVEPLHLIILFVGVSGIAFFASQLSRNKQRN